MIACIDNTVTSTKKFMMMPVLARHLYNEFCKNCDKRGAMAVEQFDDLVIISGASMLDKALLINQGYILYNEVEEKFYLDAYFHVHNRNLPKKYQRSNYSTLIDKNFFENPTTHILTKKVKVTTTSQVSTNKLIKSNLTQSQDLNIITSKEDVNTESAENETLRQSQNINTETEDVNTESVQSRALKQYQNLTLESAKVLFSDNFSEYEIVTAFSQMTKYKQKPNSFIENEYKYLRKILTNNKMKHTKSVPIHPKIQEGNKKNKIPKICLKCELKGTFECVKPGKFESYTGNGLDTKPCPYADKRSEYGTQ